ncbi:MAG: dual specificity protein phosphatase family protein [Candidatus Saccharicenans sp.]|nr:dual specificity protein phosphatase family protein [Candidatus Saccharicenans sp.]
MVEMNHRFFPARNKGKFLTPVFALLLVFLAGGNTDCRQRQLPRPENWAPPVQVEGVPNLHKVSDLLYRCAQPTASGFKELEKMGIKTVINLRSEHSDRNLLAGTNLKYYEIPSKATQVVEGDLLKFLKIATNPEEGPYLIHCHHGADRTGLFVAVYRIVVQGWSKDEAIREMQRGGFGFHNTYTNIVRYLQSFDPEKFRRALNNEAGDRQFSRYSGILQADKSIAEPAAI